MEETTEANSPNVASNEVFAPDEYGRNPTTVASTHLNGSNLIINVTLLIPTGQQDPSNQRYKIVIPATNEDQQVNLLTKSYLARLSITDSTEDNDVEESEWEDDDSRFPNAIQETCTG